MNSEGFAFEKYIHMKDYKCNCFFYDKDVKVPNHDIVMIKPLTTDYCQFLWNKYISKNKRHLMLLESQDKDTLLHNKETVFNFVEDWNNNYFDNLKNILRTTLAFDTCDAIFFFWNHSNGVETTWGIFLKYWINFLFDDEGPVLINPKSNQVVVFGPSGDVIIGERTALK